MSDVCGNNRNCASPADRPTPRNPSEDRMEDEEVYNDEDYIVLDEYRHDEDDNNDDDNDGESYRNFYSDAEVETIMEDDLPPNVERKECGKDGEDEVPYEEKEKLFLKDISHSHSDMLPEGWIQVAHNSGMPIYLHRQSRVCTMAMPYFLGEGSARKHKIPLSAIPCLWYRQALDARTLKQHQILSTESDSRTSEDGDMQQGPEPLVDTSISNASIETNQEHEVTQSLTHMEVQDYCKKLFKFETKKVLRFKSWSERRKYTKELLHQKKLRAATMPEGRHLIKFPIQKPDNAGHSKRDRSKQEWVLNPKGKNYITILHEYVQYEFEENPLYTIKEVTCPSGTYEATVTINSKQYGPGFGTSKKKAKLEAAKLTLEVLTPGLKDKIGVYGNRAVQSIMEERQEEENINAPQSEQSENLPNFAILDKLKQEMLKLRKSRAAQKPTAKFNPLVNVYLPSYSGDHSE